MCQVCVVKQMARLAEKGKSLENIGLACSKAFLGNLISLGFTHQIKSLGLITAESLGLGASWRATCEGVLTPFLATSACREPSTSAVSGTDKSGMLLSLRIALLEPERAGLGGSEPEKSWEQWQQHLGDLPYFSNMKSRVSLLISHLLSPWHTAWRASGDFQSIVPPGYPQSLQCPQCSRGKCKDAPGHQASRGASREVLTLLAAKQSPWHKSHPCQLSACAHFVMDGFSGLGAR